MIECNKRHYGTWGLYSDQFGENYRHVSTYIHKENALKAALDLGKHDHKNGRNTNYTVTEIRFMDRED
tara:strand:- start:371 stop:574 length:204 start_codon:yes stop_codon:yes gene_type:complete